MVDHKYNFFQVEKFYIPFYVVSVLLCSSISGQTVNLNKSFTVFSIKTETWATTPPDRARKKIGVGEEVTLKITPTPSTGGVSWTISGNGTLSSNTGNAITFYAPDRATNSTITATHNSNSKQVSFNVIEPTGAIIEREPGTGIFHVQGVPTAGFIGRAYETPADVSFHNIETQEGECQAVCTGYFSYQNGLTHNIGSWVSVGAVVTGKGSKENATDQIQGASDNHQPYVVGTFDWPIPWFFRVNGGAAKEFTTVNHHKEIDASGKVTVSKGGTSVSTNLNDPSSTY